jgi:hypothetical protein
MARVTNNALTRGLSGRVGGLVFRQVQEETIVSAAPGPTQLPASDKQRAHRQRFFAAQCYAAAQLQDPAARALYATGIDDRRRSARVVAIADYMNAPCIVAVDLSGCRGGRGDTIRVAATDDFAVTAVTLHLETAEGALLEEGAATPLPGGDWTYTLHATHAPTPGRRLRVRAYDRPGNVTEQTYPL